MRGGDPRMQRARQANQADDLKAAFHAGCRRILVRTGLGLKRLTRASPNISSR